ncbi:MAG: MerR family transcriptional regulator [Desulfobacca sp.]|uniref:MerR family transcriptional regulator n=1 Tax=Desulfobacca sp. TaxID=2067990 RepID=UPI00404A6808
MQEIGKNILLSIDQVARLTGVKKSTLRYWEKTFPEYLQPSRTFSKRREYSLAEVELIETIKKLLEEEHLTNLGVRMRLRTMSGKGNGYGQQLMANS